MEPETSGPQWVPELEPELETKILVLESERLEIVRERMLAVALGLELEPKLAVEWEPELVAVLERLARSPLPPSTWTPLSKPRRSISLHEGLHSSR